MSCPDDPNHLLNVVLVVMSMLASGFLGFVVGQILEFYKDE